MICGNMIYKITIGLFLMKVIIKTLKPSITKIIQAQDLFQE